MVAETYIEVLREKLEHISPLLRLGVSIDAFLGAWMDFVELRLSESVACPVLL
jgi:hypothetical protein